MIIKPFFTLAIGLSLAIPLFAKDSPASFNFNDWKKSQGTPFDIKEWQLLRKRQISGMIPNISKTTTQVRLTLDVAKGGVRLNELHLMTPAAIVKKSHLSW